MAIARPFSLRNKPAINSGQISVDMPLQLRKRLIVALLNLDQGLSIQRDPNDNWTTNTSIIIESARELWTVHADDALEEIVNGPYDVRTVRIRKHLAEGNGYQLLDFIEFFYRLHDSKQIVTDQVNATMEEEGSRWHLFDGLFDESLAPIPRAIREVIMDSVRRFSPDWAGTLGEEAFTARLVNMTELPSNDDRYPNFAGDFHQHRINNIDWSEDWILDDKRVNLIGCDERRFIKFIELLINPDLQSDPQILATLADRIGRSLNRCGYRLDRSNVRVGISRFSVVHGSSSDQLGEGGFGVVRRAVLDGKTVAVKTLKHERRDERDAVERFKHEIDCLKRLAHLPNVIKLVSESIAGDVYCYAMEWADCSLEDYLLRSPNLSNNQRMELVDQMLLAFVAIHEAQVVHRDICPRNILMQGNSLKVGDFGLALDRENVHGLTRTSMRAGKDGYAAPELNDGIHKADERSDIFAVGKVMHQILTGRDPFAEAFGLYAPIIRQATDPSSSRRYQTVREMLEATRKHHAILTEQHAITTLSELQEQLATSQEIDLALLHHLIVNAQPDSTYDDFWDPLTGILVGIRRAQYASWAATNRRIEEYVHKCSEMYKRLPRVGWPFNAVGAMAETVFNTAVLSESGEGILLAFTLLWPVGFTQDQWAVRDMLLDYMTKKAFHGNETLIGHVISIIVSHPIATVVQTSDLRQLPQKVAATLRRKIDQEKTDGSAAPA